MPPEEEQKDLASLEETPVEESKKWAPSTETFSMSAVSRGPSPSIPYWSPSQIMVFRMVTLVPTTVVVPARSIPELSAPPATLSPKSWSSHACCGL